MAETITTSFQARVQPWLLACFGEVVASDRGERNHRFLEEALELVQACGCTAGEAHQLVDYVYKRPAGEKGQEVGGVMTTLAALCLAQGIDMHQRAEVELARIWTKIEQIRAKQANKPKHSPLPEHARARAHDKGATVQGDVLALPRELTPEVADVLRIMCFEAGPIAHAFRDAGRADIKRRAEDEQAFVLHWLLTLALEHGVEWRKHAGEVLKPVIAEAKVAREAREAVRKARELARD